MVAFVVISMISVFVMLLALGWVSAARADVALGITELDSIFGLMYYV
jgi:hypothetical protein